MCMFIEMGVIPGGRLGSSGGNALGTVTHIQNALNTEALIVFKVQFLLN